MSYHINHYSELNDQNYSFSRMTLKIVLFMYIVKIKTFKIGRNVTAVSYL